MRAVVTAVLRKELIDGGRDWRALGSALLYAVWGPGVMVLALTAVARNQAADAPLTLAVGDLSRAAGLAAFLEERSVTVVPAPRDPSARIAARDLPVALLVSNGFAEDFADARPAGLTLLYDGAWTESSTRAGRVRNLVADYSRRVADTRLVLRGISPTAINPVRLGERDLSTAAARSARILGMLPIFLLVSAFIGGLGLTADMMAGERERGSLESLLIHPVPPAAILAGKWAAAAVVCGATMTLTMVVSQVLLEHPRLQAIDAPVGLSMADFARIWLLMAPLVLLSTVVQLTIALFARTYKEAQTHLSLLIFLPMLPGFMLAFGSMETAGWMTWFPLLGQQLATSDVLRGEAPAVTTVASLAGATLAAAAAVFVLAARLLDRETIVASTAG
jgi:sodium transport system permease protein